ncbi:hypothetical protein HMPREF9141_0578 [Prevotella multiformis DSM 16608]|uniref:Uncharacterized protein n=1 Tax=Prevotella multiformis DSM 16608 TaxID=888743 RepID=F0F4R2_9BACT|nr:hypothetical protein HMPREF9141_0578 [Prevotella multiformis DSM 16608]
MTPDRNRPGSSRTVPNRLGTGVPDLGNRSTDGREQGSQWVGNNFPAPCPGSPSVSSAPNGQSRKLPA